MTAVIEIKVIANARRNEVSGRMADGKIKVRINQKPVAGKANQAIVEFLSEKLSVPKTAIQIITGDRSKIKRIQIDGMERTEAERKLLD